MIKVSCYFLESNNNQCIIYSLRGSDLLCEIDQLLLGKVWCRIWKVLKKKADMTSNFILTLVNYLFYLASEKMLIDAHREYHYFINSARLRISGSLISFKFHLYNALCTFDNKQGIKITQIYFSAKCTELIFTDVQEEWFRVIYFSKLNRDSI